jgi:predicted LPLAT superfamily acyltransferase
LSIVGGGPRAMHINVVMHVDKGTHVRSLLDRSNAGAPYRIIPLGEPASMLRAKECLERGEIVGILADRVYGNEPTQSVPFLGEAARFSLSPLRLARITGAPVVMVFGLFRGGRRYDIVFEALADGVAGGLAEMEEALTECMIRYAATLERHARLAPYNWFNFYDFWSARA